METVRLGIIGCGLMGREIASASARWCHLTDIDVQPELVAICDLNPDLFGWYTAHFPSIRQTTGDYKELLANQDVDAVYCAVPHNLHESLYCATLEAGKHLLGEKPFGIDKAANDAIMACAAKHPSAFVRCTSQFPFFPAMQRLAELIDTGACGRIIEYESGFLHGSDLDPSKPINWKRRLATNGEYGAMGDLGIHACHTGFRAGFVPQTVSAVLSNIVTERPDGTGNCVPCETLDNATLLCETLDTRTGLPFPWTLKTQRIAPGQTNTWYARVYGTKTSARFSTTNPRRLEMLEYGGGAQSWQHIDMGYETAFKAITGRIFEFGFSDALQQMLAAFLYELTHGRPWRTIAACVTPAEAALSHRLFTAALKSQRTHTMVRV